MYLRAAKTEAEDAGESTDGMANSVSELRSEILKLTGNAVDIQKNNSTFKSTYEILKELAGVWKNLSDVSQANILELIGGKRNANVAAAFLENFDIAEKAMKTSAESAGSAVAENEKYLDSAQGKINLMKAAFEDFSRTVIKSNTIKLFVDLGTAILNVANALTQMSQGFSAIENIIMGITSIASFKNLGLFRTIGTDKEGFTNRVGIFRSSFADIASAFSSGGFKGAFNEIMSTTAITKSDVEILHKYDEIVKSGTANTAELNKVMSSGSKAAQQMMQAANGVAIGEAKIQEAASRTTGSLIRQKLATIGLKLASVALNVGLTMLASIAINAVIDAFQNWQRQQQEIIDKTYEAAKSLDEETSSIEDYKKKILELRTALDDNNISQSAAQSKREELMTIQDELIDKYGKEKDSINNITDAINGQIDALDKLSEKKVEDWGKQNGEGMSSAEKYWTEDVFWKIDPQGEFNKNRSVYDFISGNKTKINNRIGFVATNKDRLGEDVNWLSVRAENRKDFIDSLNKLYDEVQNYGKTEYSLSDEEISNILTDISNTINYYNDQNAEDGNYNKQKLNAEKSALYKIFTVKDDNGDLKYKPFYDNLNQTIEQYKKVLETKDYKQIQEAKQAYEEALKQIADNTGEGKIIDDTTETGENVKMYLNSIEDEIQSIVDNNEFYIKVDTDKIKTIIAKSSKGSEKRTINAIDLTTMFKADVDKNGVLSEEENKQLGYSETFVTAYNEIAKAAEDAGISIDSLIKSLEKEGFVASNIGSQSKAVTNVFTTYSDEISSITSQADKLKSAYSNLLKGDLSKPDVMSLVQEFPKLATYVDLADLNFGNLAQGIQDISGGIADSLIQKLNGIDKSMLTEDELKAYNLLVEYLKNIGIQAQKSLIWLQKIQSTISSVSSSLSSAYSMLNEITDENGNGMLSLSSIDTILTNDAFTSLRPYIDDMSEMQESLKGFIETQKDAYESLANQDLYESDYDKFKSEVDKKAESNSSFISDTIEEINDGISKIESTYKVDLTNWNNLSEDKKTLLANTNAELLVKQRGIIDKFKDTYNVDLTNYKNFEAAKTAIKAAAETQKRNELLETARLEAENKYAQSQLNDPLFGDIYRNSKANFLYWATNSNSAKKEIKQAGEEALREAYSIFNAITIPDTDWSKILEGNGNKNKSSSKQEFSKQFDWIEVAINKIKKVVSDLSSKVSNTYSTWSSRNKSLKQELKSVSKEINVQRNAYAAYIREANAVGLSSYWKNRVQNGAMDISTIKDERLANQISSYQELYNKAMDCQDAIQELKLTMSSLYETSFNNVKSEFESKLNLIENQINQYNNKITMIETNGYLKTVKYYNSLYNDTKNKITTLQSEYKSLTNQLNNAVNSGQIDKYSESWYSMNSQILDVKDSISQANIQLSEFSKTMRQIGWDNFDYLQERISQVSNESNFLIDLMSNDKLYTDKGQFNKLGMATLGLRGQNYNVYMSQADQYYKELIAVNKELSKDKYNTDLIERREKLLSLQQESIKAAEDEKNAIVDLVKNGIQAELDSLKELIDKYNDALDSAKNLYDYQNNISDKTSEIASLRKQLLAYSNDTSEETKATIQKLQVSLSDAEKDLKETEYDKYISDQKELLDNLYSDYEEILNKRLDNVDALVNDMINVVNNNSKEIGQTIKNEANNVGYSITSNMQSIWSGSTNSINSTLSKYGNKFTEQLTAVNNTLSSIGLYVSHITSAGNSFSATNPKGNYSNTTSTNVSSNSGTNKITVGSIINASGAKIYKNSGGLGAKNQEYAYDPIYTVIEDENSLGLIKVRWHNLSSGVTGWFKKSDVKAYKSGGLVDYTGLAQLDGTPQNPEMVLNSEDTKNFIALKDAMSRIAEGKISLGDLFKENYNTEVLKQLSKVNSPFATKETSIGNITYNINIPIDHVQDFNDFMNQMRKDSKFEKMIQSMTVDRLLGKSGLAKNKYEWK